MALAAGYALWKHTTSRSKLPRLYVYVSTGIFLATSVLQYLIVLQRNFSFRKGHSHALISKHRGSVRMTIYVPRLLDIKAGQYVNVWIPSVSFWSFLQSHPFTIASWAQQEGTTSLDLIVEPRKGLTQKLYACAEYHKGRSGKGTEGLEERPVHYGKPQEGSSAAVDSHISQKTLSESIELKRTGHVEGHGGSLEEGFENTTPSNFGYESYEGEP